MVVEEGGNWRGEEAMSQGGPSVAMAADVEEENVEQAARSMLFGQVGVRRA